MDTVLRALAMYAFLLVIFRVGGKRSLAQITAFDFVLLLIISETTQQALTGQDYSVTNAFLLVLTLVTVDIVLSLVKRHSPRVDRLVEGRPLVLVNEGKPIAERMAMERVDEEDILSAARTHHGLESLSQIRYAVLERNGGIAIIARKDA